MKAYHNHTDEVHERHSSGYRIITVADKLIFGYDYFSLQHCGIGANDKNGIWMCLKCLDESDYLKCAFFVSEEIGCVGSHKAGMSFFKDCRFVIQCDRRGHEDLVTEANAMELCSRQFLEDLQQDGQEILYNCFKSFIDFMLFRMFMFQIIGIASLPENKG
ncbi:hypothetical protein IR083_03650 [Dysgonomonas sp. GY75]|uniref:hypothetical protein n=1 Tax=Dysgonomonas sp. GY75 TaxID=2780419 RepID=UPI001883443C|nr:hypothetical protein [Dysgonomonas sp. GY75]